MGDLRGKSILITGGTQGLGRELALRLDKLGAELVIVARRGEYYDEFKDELTGEHEFYPVDVSNNDEVLALRDTLKDRHIDVLLCNAGVFTTNSLESGDVKYREDALRINLLGAINVTEAFLPKLLKCRHVPQIVFTNSVAATQGFGGEGPEWATYNASKWGLKGYMMALKEQMKGENIKIGAVYPGGFESNIYENAGSEEGDPEHELPWMMDTGTVAEAVVFMLSQPDDANVDELVITKHFGSGEK